MEDNKYLPYMEDNKYLPHVEDNKYSKNHNLDLLIFKLYIDAVVEYVCL